MPAIPGSVQPWLLQPSALSLTTGDLIVGDGQVQWGNLLLGADPYFTEEIAGWEDLPGIDSGNVARPATHGSWPGRFLGQERVVTWTGWNVPIDRRESLQASVRWVRSNTTITNDPTEYPLVVRTLGETLMCWGKVSNRAVATDIAYGAGGARTAIQWTCSDPRRYELDEQLVMLTLDDPPGAGLSWPLTYPLVWGPEATTTSSAVLVNSMDAPTPPTITITGPLDTPLVVNQTTGRQLEFALVLTETDVLTIDCRQGTVLLNGVSDRLYTRTARSGPVAGFELQGGDNVLALRSVAYSPGNTAVIRWRSATF